MISYNGKWAFFDQFFAAEAPCTVWVTKIDASKYYNCNLHRNCSYLKFVLCVGPALLLMEKIFLTLDNYFLFCKLFCKKNNETCKRKKFRKKVSTSLNAYCVSGCPWEDSDKFSLPLDKNIFFVSFFPRKLTPANYFVKKFKQF
jgi:hypothetical protein